MHVLYISLAFLALQVIFNFVEVRVEHCREQIKHARYGSFVAFFMHPTTVNSLHDLGIYVAAEFPKLVFHH